MGGRGSLEGIVIVEGSLEVEGLLERISWFVTNITLTNASA